MGSLIMIENPEHLNSLNLTLGDKIQSRKSGRFSNWVHNVPIAFDIETTSAYVDNEKVAFMYIWQIAIREDVYMGRTWEIFIEFCKSLRHQNEGDIIIYVHNLSFEFSFIQKLFTWDKKGQLMIDQRKPCKIRTIDGIEFRCSYLLSNAPLKDLPTKKYKKMEGDLDYSLIRTPGTPLDEDELKYCINDVLVLTEYIQMKIDEYSNISQIPLTSTGVVRNFCKTRCNQQIAYRDIIKDLTLEPDEYLMLKQCFQGGFTHASIYHSGDVIDDVTSYDFTSSYPAVMVSEKFPMSKGVRFEYIDMEDYQRYARNFCVVAIFRFVNIKSKLYFEHPISSSKCQIKGEFMTDNGRIVKADDIIIVITELDFKTISEFYEWDAVEILGGYYYRKDYLPKTFIECIFEFYQGKTSLKGVPEKEDEYMRKKACLNSCYGMIVTDIVKPDCKYIDNEWVETEPSLPEAIEKYNKNKGRFLFYPWGVYVTSYARRNLFTGIKECGENGNDYIYSDTDSVKITHPERHKEYFDRYNEEVKQKVENVVKAFRIPIELSFPKTIKGETKPIGVWDFDGHYDKFKTLGAKRYLYCKGDEIHLTLSGVQKTAGQNFLKSKFGDTDKIFKGFTKDLYFTPEGTGKMTHTYIDDRMEFDIRDYTGHKYHIISESGTHLEGCGYYMSISETYQNLIYSIRGMLI